MIALVTGGAASGKSAFAESLALCLPGPHVYLATMRHGDAETESRIARHRAARADKGFVTVELFGEKPASLPDAATILVEDLGNLVLNLEQCRGSAVLDPARGRKPTVLDPARGCKPAGGASSGSPAAEGGKQRQREALHAFDALRACALAGAGGPELAPTAGLQPRAGSSAADLRFPSSRNVIYVGNEVGCDGVRYDGFTRGFIERLGALSCGIAAVSDLVVEVVAGMPNVVKGELPCRC